MKLKKSFYNLEISKEIDGKILLYNSYSGALGVIEPDVYKIYSNIEVVNEDEILEQKILDNIETMISNGFLVDANEDELKKIELENRLIRYNITGTNTLHLTIAPTLNCNMSCPYCYEKKENKNMSDEVQEKLEVYIKNYILAHKEIKNLDVAWYGGEPLLVKDIITHLSQKFITFCNENNINYGAHIITNGVLLNKETAIELKERCLITGVQITLDGVGEKNNITRVLKNGEDSFKIITENINQVKDIIRISVRVNVSKENNKECIKLIEYFNEMKWNKKVDLYFAPVKDSEFSDLNTSNIVFNPEEFNENLIEYQKTLIKLKLYDNVKYPTNYEGCSALSINNLVVDPDGNFYKCWHRINIKKHQIGNVYKGITPNNEYRNWLLIGMAEKCKTCKTYPVCRSGCPELRTEDENNVICEMPENYVKKLIKIYYENLILSKNKNEEVV